MLVTVALFSPVPDAIAAREHGAWRRRKPSTAARLVARMSVWSAVCVLKVRPVSSFQVWLSSTPLSCRRVWVNLFGYQPN